MGMGKGRGGLRGRRKGLSSVEGVRTSVRDRRRMDACDALICLRHFVNSLNAYVRLLPHVLDSFPFSARRILLHGVLPSFLTFLIGLQLSLPAQLLLTIMNTLYDISLLLFG
jgi:hypothetical protein